MFVSAALLFLVEPMLAKMVLPMLGGTPAVWNTCLVFFQAVLLCGYLYAHASSKWLGRRTQIVLHFSLTLMALVVLPLRIPAGWEPPAQSSPVPWILGMLSLAVGLPFFLISSSTPMLQRWFAHSGHKSAHDPYFLYAASNAGSLVGLLGYPLLLEPTLRLSEQSRIWTYGYLFFVAMTTVCGIFVWNFCLARANRPAKCPSTDRTSRRNQEQPMAEADALGGTGFCALEPDDGRYHGAHHRRSGHSTLLGVASGALPVELCDGLHEPAAIFPRMARPEASLLNSCHALSHCFQDPATAIAIVPFVFAYAVCRGSGLPR